MLVEILSKIVGGIAAGLATTLTGLLVTLYVKYKNDWQSIRRLRKSLKNSPHDGYCRYYILCGLLKIFLGHFYCCCYGCCTCKRKKDPADSNKETITDGIDLVNSKAKAITATTFEDMKKRYQNYRYKHQHYCYKNGKKCKPSECEHDSSRKCKGLLRNPMLYLIELDFSKLENHLKSWLLKIHNVEDPDNQKVEEKLKDYRDNPRKLIFEIALSRDGKDAKALEKIQGKLNEKIKNVCIVANNVTKKRCEFSNSEKVLLHSLFQLHKNHKVQLIYNVR